MKVSLARLALPVKTMLDDDWLEVYAFFSPTSFQTSSDCMHNIGSLDEEERAQLVYRKDCFCNS